MGVLENALCTLTHSEFSPNYNKEKFLNIYSIGTEYHRPGEECPNAYKVILSGWGLDTCSTVCRFESAKIMLKDMAQHIEQLPAPSCRPDGR
jgi:hypothetical protein